MAGVQVVKGKSCEGHYHLTSIASLLEVGTRTETQNTTPEK